MRSKSTEAALSGMDVTFVHNPDYASGLSSSLKAGVAALPESASGALILLGDMPRVSAKLLDRLIAAFAERPETLAVIPVIGGERGNPALLSRALFAKVATLEGDAGARRLLETGRPSAHCRSRSRRRRDHARRRHAAGFGKGPPIVAGGADPAKSRPHRGRLQLRPAETTPSPAAAPAQGGAQSAR